MIHHLYLSHMKRAYNIHNPHIRKTEEKGEEVKDSTYLVDQTPE